MKKNLQRTKKNPQKIKKKAHSTKKEEEIKKISPTQMKVIGKKLNPNPKLVHTNLLQ